MKPAPNSMAAVVALLAVGAGLAAAAAGPWGDRRPATAAAVAAAAPAVPGHAPTPPGAADTVPFETAWYEGLKLVRHDGQPFDPTALRGRTVLVNFAFTTCGTTCPATTRQLQQLQAQLARHGDLQVSFVTVSVDPLSDTPERLTAYARSHGVDLGNWQWLTGTPQDVQRLMERMTGHAGANGDPLAHPTALSLLDGFGRRIARFDGLAPDVARLEREMRNLDRTLGARARAQLATS